MRATLTVAIIALATAGTTVPSFAKDGDIRLRCHARAQNQIRLHVNYEERLRSKGVREKFRVEFEARAGAVTSGQQVSIIVDGIPVGTLNVTPAPSGEVSGELDFDSKIGNGHTAFPANFPDIAVGSEVDAAAAGSTLVGCQVQ
jgi:hypothetical protein